MMDYIDLYYDLEKEYAGKREVMKICCCDEQEAIVILLKLILLADKYHLKIHHTFNDVFVPMSILKHYLGENRINRYYKYHFILNDFKSKKRID